MSNAFGTKFVIVNDVQQMLDPKVFIGGPWVHLATVHRGFKEYMAFKHLENNKMYIEAVNPNTPGLLEKIECDKEWGDLFRFLRDAGLLSIAGKNKELKGGKDGLPGFFYNPTS